MISIATRDSCSGIPDHRRKFARSAVEFLGAGWSDRMRSTYNTPAVGASLTSFPSKHSCTKETSFSLTVT